MKNDYGVVEPNESHTPNTIISFLLRFQHIYDVLSRTFYLTNFQNKSREN